MRMRMSLIVGLLVLWLGSPSRADDAAEIKALLQLLEKRLAAIESPAAASQGERVTEIGASSSRRPIEEEEPKLVVRIYDLSDLFTIARSYVARQSSDLQTRAAVSDGQSARAMFADAPRAVGANPWTTGGGLGGALGIGGGFGGGVPATGGGSMNVSEGDLGKSIPRHIAPQVGGFGLGNAESDFGGARISFDDLIETITAAIEPTEWEEVGGPGSIDSLGNALVVRATPSTHQQIDNLLNLLRQKWGTLRTVSIEAWWLWMTETQADELLRAGRPKGEHAKVFGAVDNALFGAQIAELAKDEKANPGYRAKITCYNGQTVFTVSGGQQLFVTDRVPVVSQDATAYQPVVSLVQEGAALQVRPHVTRAGKYAAIDVHTRINLLAQRDPDAAAKPQPDAPAIDRPLLRNARLATSMRVPVDQVMLVGAMSFDSRPEVNNPILYLFTKVSVQELRDDQPEEAAGEGIERK